MERGYVETQENEYFLTGSRVTLASLVECWKDGLSPESIREEFPTLTLEQVYGAITFYLHNPACLEADASHRASDLADRSQEAASRYPEITLKLRSRLHGAKQ